MRVTYHLSLSLYIYTWLSLLLQRIADSKHILYQPPEIVCQQNEHVFVREIYVQQPGMSLLSSPADSSVDVPEGPAGSGLVTTSISCR